MLSARSLALNRAVMDLLPPGISQSIRECGLLKGVVLMKVLNATIVLTAQVA